MTARYAIGLDVGDGESSIAWVPADSHPSERAQPFERTPGEVSIVSAYAQRADDDAYLIGDEALLSDEVIRIQVNFKNRPKLSTDGVAQPMLAPFFAQLFWLEFQARHPDVANDCTIHVGCPAGWNAGEIALYQAQLEANLKPRTVTVVPESQSAFLYVHDSAGVNPALRPVLVVDVGSSTTDFTLVDVDDQSVNLGFGDGLGCRDIDQAMRDAIIESLPVSDRALLRNNRSASKLLLWLCRRWKEAAFGGATPQRPKGQTEHQQLVLRTCWDALSAFNVPRLVDHQWRPRLRGELVALRQHLSPPQLPRLILTTGGGSRMPLVDELCHEIFPSVDINPAPEPSLAVARGLASYGRWRHRVDVFRTKVANLADSKDIDNTVRKDATRFARRFYESFYIHTPEIYLQLIDEVDAGADPAELFTLPALHSRFTSWLDTTEGAAARTKILGPLERVIGNELTPHAAKLCRELGLDSAVLTVSIRLPAGLSVKARQPWVDKFLNMTFELGGATYMKTRLGRSYMRVSSHGMRAIRPLETAMAPLPAMMFKLDEIQLKDLAIAIRGEVRSQLVERVRPIERLLAT